MSGASKLEGAQELEFNIKEDKDKELWNQPFCPTLSCCKVCQEKAWISKCKYEIKCILKWSAMDARDMVGGIITYSKQK